MNENEMNNGVQMPQGGLNNLPEQNMGQAPQYGMPEQNMGQAPQYEMPNQNIGQAPQYGMPNQNIGQASQYGMPNQNIGQAPQYEMPNQNMVQQPPKKKKKGLKIAACVAGAVVAAGLAGGVCYAYVPTVQNAVNKRILSPEKYYLYVEQKALEEKADFIANQYGKGIDTLSSYAKENNAKSGSFKFDVNDTLKSESGLEDYLPIELTVDSYTEKGYQKTKATEVLKMGKDKIGTFELYQDMTGGSPEMYFAIPELSDSFLKASSEGKVEELDPSIVEDVTSSIQNFIKEPTSKELVSYVINEYGIEFFESASDVKMKKDVDYTVDKSKESVTELDVTVNEENLNKALADALEKMKTDKKLIAECERMKICSKEEYQDSIKKALDEVKAKKSFDKDNKMTMSVYVDGSGDILGRDVTVGSDGDEVTMTYHTLNVKDVNKFQLDLAKGDAEKLMVVNGSYKDGKNGVNGNVHFEIPSISADADLEFNDIKVTDDGTNMLLGTAKLSSSKLSGYTADFKGSKEGDAVVEHFGVSAGAMELEYIELGMKNAKYEAIELPSADKTIEMKADDPSSVQAYTQTIKQEYITWLEQKFAPLADKANMVESWLGNLGIPGFGSTMGSDDYSWDDSSDSDYSWDDSSDSDYSWDDSSDSDGDYSWDDSSDSNSYELSEDLDNELSGLFGSDSDSDN